MDVVRRMYNNVIDSTNSRDTANVTNCNPLLIELHDLQNKIEAIESKANQLVEEAKFTSCDDDSKLNKIVTSAIRSISGDPTSSSQFDYQVKLPLQLQDNEKYHNEIHELEQSILTLQSNVMILKEQTDNHPFDKFIEELEHIATILNPKFLRRMEKEYDVRFLCNYIIFRVHYREVLEMLIKESQNQLMS